MVSLGIALRQLASQRNVAVLYTNHSVGGDRDADGYSAEETKPALGMSWRNQRASCALRPAPLTPGWRLPAR